MSTIEAGRYNQLTPADIDTQPEAAAPKMTPRRRDVRSLCEVPEPSKSALAYYARSQHEVEQSVRACRVDLPVNDSALADALRSPILDQGERHQVIQRLAREGDARAFYGNDTIRLYHGLHQAVSDDHRVIANGVQSAFASGAIDARDLQRIADAHPDGAQRFMAILCLGDNSRDAGNVTQQLADALWTRNGADGKDRATAAMYFTSDPAVMARTLDTADKRATAFEALVDFNQSKPYAQWPPGVAADWKNDALSAPARLFAAHGQELVDRYTDATPERYPQPRILAVFFSHNIMNPEAKGIALDHQRELVPTVRSTLSDVVDTYFNRGRDPAQQISAMQQLGVLTAGVSGATSLALTEYSSKVAAQEEARKEVAAMVGNVIGTLTAKLDKLLGKPAEKVTSGIVEQILKHMQTRPSRPETIFSDVLYGEITKRVARLGDELKNDGLLTHFGGLDGTHGYRVHQNLNINPGGHAR